MKIIYNQSQTLDAFECFGPKSFCFKQLLFKDDMDNTTKKMHHHTEFEIHIIKNGQQTYKTENKEYILNDGEFLIVPPGTKHCTTSYKPPTSKISITFKPKENVLNTKICSGKITEEMRVGITFIEKESKNASSLSCQLVENRIFELIMLILRLSGYKETIITNIYDDVDPRLSVIKQYIKDNVELNLTVSDVAAYCYLSTKQLTRLFKSIDKTTPSAYIQRKKIEHIEKLLTETTLRINEISDIMNFSNEYHFNSFFSKHAGMSPGEYRKMNNCRLVNYLSERE